MKTKKLRKPMKRKLAWSVAAAVALATGGTTTAVLAQDAEAELEELRVEEISVTGTRIRRQDYNSANPVATFGADELESLGLVNVADAINQMPSNVSQFTPSNTGGSAFFVGSTLPNLRGLNPFFGTRTLTLVDSRRHVPTNQGGSVDLNFIPSVLIDRMETVTGGASASYGSEAISGVVNILLDNDFEGFKFDADYGVSDEGDGDNVHYGMAFGTSFADGRGHLVIGGEFQDQDPIADCSSARDWCGESWGTFSNASGGGAFDPLPNPRPMEDPAIPGQPQNIIMSNLRHPSSVHGKIYYDDVTQEYRFNDAGTDIVPYDSGEFSHISPNRGTVIGGEGKSIHDHLALMPDLERQVFMAHASYDFTPSVRGFAEVSYGEVSAVNLQFSPGQNSVVMCIRPDNAFLQQGSEAMQAEMAAQAGNDEQGCAADFMTGAAPGTTIIKDFNPETNQMVTTDTEVMRMVMGLSGDIFQTWHWDAYYQYGKTERDQIGHDYRTNHRFAMAVDSVIHPETGEPVCRVSINPLALPVGADESLAEGCVPLNPFGRNNISEEALDYAYGSLTEFNEIDQHVAEFSLSGEVWEGWGYGPMLAAGGVQYRYEELVNDAGEQPLVERTDYGLQYGDPFGGDVEIWEYFTEVEMPLLANVRGAELWNLNAAVRRAEYTNTGGLNTTGETADVGMTSWKLSSVWDPLDWLRIRGSLSQDVRAAGFRELYYSQTIPAGGFFGAINPNPWLPDTGPFSQFDESQLILSGNPGLDPEKAKTRTIGFVLTPDQWISGLQLSVDYYDIELTGGIRGGNTAEVVDQCFQGDEQMCGYIQFGEPHTDYPDNPRSNIVSVRAPYVNDNPYESSGVDIAVNYAFELDDWIAGVPGSMSVRLLSTHAIETLVQSGGETIDIAGQTGGFQGFLEDYAPAPDWSSNLIVTYMHGPFMLTTQARYTGEGVLDKQTPKIGPDDPGYDPSLTTTVTDNTLPSHTVWNMTGSYNLPFAGGNVNLYLNVDNVFDRDPPFAAGAVGGANPMFFDTMGRTYRLGFRSRF